MSLPPNYIFVPQGAEAAAIRRGLKKVPVFPPLVLSTPMSALPLQNYLQKCLQEGYFNQHKPPRILLMGLCGSLSPQYRLGDIVIYESCIYATTKGLWRQNCDSSLTHWLQERLPNSPQLVTGLMSDQIICQAQKKQQLAQQYPAQVVDMEGFAALEIFSNTSIPVAMVRVVSDDFRQNLPDLNCAVTNDGSLATLPLAIEMLRQPLAALNLIRGSLQAIQVLQQITTILFSASGQQGN